MDYTDDFPLWEVCYGVKFKLTLEGKRTEWNKKQDYCLQIKTCLFLLDFWNILRFQGSVAIAGAAVKWLRDNLNMIEKASEIRKYEDNTLHIP